jgi:dephospho-CoA kinase
VVNELYGDSEVRAAVVQRFGYSVAPDGEVDRSALARRAFAAPEDRAWLERLLWPRVSAAMAAWRDEVERRASQPRAAVVEVPLLFESGMEHIFDATVAVIADERVRERRAATRAHASLDERLARQLTQEQKAQRATFVVVNDGTVDELEAELSAVLEKLQRVSAR